jgi:alpha-L-rhamnosidase
MHRPTRPPARWLRQLSNPLLQRVYQNSVGSEASALMSIPNGAAARGERAGWTGDAGAACESEMVDFDAGAFFAQYLGQVASLACDSDGTLANCIPESDPRRDGANSRPDPATCSGQTADASWSTVFPAVAHNLWRYYNATGVLRTHYAKLRKYMTTIGADINATGLGNTLCEWGDWNPVKKTPCQITSATSFIRDLGRMADVAAAIGETVRPHACAHHALGQWC